MRRFQSGLLAFAIIIATPAARMVPAADEPALVEEDGLRTNQFVTEAALWIVFKIEAGQMAAELARDPALRSFAEQMVADQREAALALTRAANAAAVEADALERLQTHHPHATADGPGTVGDRNMLRAREATADAPGSQSRTGSPEAPGSAPWSATEAGQMIERRLADLRDMPVGQFDTAFVRHVQAAHAAELALYEAYAAGDGRQALHAYATTQVADIRRWSERAQDLPTH